MARPASGRRHLPWLVLTGLPHTCAKASSRQQQQHQQRERHRCMLALLPLLCAVLQRRAARHARACSSFCTMVLASVCALQCSVASVTGPGRQATQ